MECLGGSISLTSGFHPESNPESHPERSYCQDRPGEWAAFVPWAEMAQNPLRHSSTNSLLGYQPVLAPWHQSQTETPAVDDWFRRAEETWDAAHVHLQRAVLRHHNRSEAPVFDRSSSRPETPALPEAGSAVCGAI